MISLYLFRCFCSLKKDEGREEEVEEDPTYENRTSLPGSISKSSESESAVFGLITSSMNFTWIGSSRKISYLSIDSKSIAMKNGQGISVSIRFPHLKLSTS